MAARPLAATDAEARHAAPAKKGWLAVFASDRVSSFLIAVFGLIIVCVIAGGVAQLLRTAREARKLHLFTGYRITPSRLILLIAGGMLLLLVPGGILFVVWDSFWLSTHGGGTAIALTGSILVLAALLVSALVRLLVSAVLAIVVFFKPGTRGSVLGSSFASVWTRVKRLASLRPRFWLLTGLAPVLMFTGHDPWPPERVDAFLSKSTAHA